MSHKFNIFSTEQGASLVPDDLATEPLTLIEFDEDPDTSNYEPDGNDSDRGSVYQTLGGVVYQDFGVNEADGIISFSALNSISSATRSALKTAYETVDGEWYFTDGYNCWKVRFSRYPKGFKSWRNILYAYHGKTYYSYEIQLLIISEDI